MVLWIEVEQHLEHARSHLEIVDQEVVHGRGIDRLKGRTGIGMLPFEIDLLVLGDQFDDALKGMKAFVAGLLDILVAFLQFVRVTQYV